MHYFFCLGGEFHYKLFTLLRVITEVRTGALTMRLSMALRHPPIGLKSSRCCFYILQQHSRPQISWLWAEGRFALPKTIRAAPSPGVVCHGFALLLHQQPPCTRGPLLCHLVFLALVFSSSNYGSRIANCALAAPNAFASLCLRMEVGMMRGCLSVQLLASASRIITPLRHLETSACPPQPDI